MTVAAAALVPGVRIRIAGIEPPYSAPTYVDARTTTATVGSMPYVNGSSSAIVIDGEMPGSAPPRIPQATPPNAAGMIGVLKKSSSTGQSNDGQRPDGWAIPSN